MTIKFEQVAFHVPDIGKAVHHHSKYLGMSNWVFDNVKGRVSVFGGEWEPSEAQLAFNYDAGYEYELLHYTKGNNWHAAKYKPVFKETFFSHKSIHVEDIDAEKKKYRDLGFTIAQEMITEQHTNQYLIDQKRTYHYVIFDSEEKIGFDLKLIKRIQA